MTFISRIGALTATAAVSALLLPAAAAGAAEVVPGSPMRMPGNQPEGFPVQIPDDLVRTSCSQGVAGTVTLPDGTKKNIMVTAAHCVVGINEPNPDPEVFIPTHEGDKVVGTTDKGELVTDTDLGEDATVMEQARILWEDLNQPDWGTVALNDGVTTSRIADSKDQFGQSHGEPVELTGIRDYQDIAVYEVSLDNAGQPICKDGSTSGRSCGVQILRTRNSIWSVGMGYQHGDSGGVNFDPETGEVLGVTSLSLFGIDRAQTADAALQDAYGIPDGQVNQHFALPASTEKADDMRTLQEDTERAQAWAEENVPPRDLDAEMQEAIANAADDAVATTGQLAEDTQGLAAAAATGDPQAIKAAAEQTQGTVEGAVGTVQGHAATISEIGALQLIKKIGESQEEGQDA